MDGVRDDGDHLWRGGHRIEIEHEPDVFTPILAGDAPLRERLEALPDVTEVKRVQADVVKVTVAPEVRYEVMADLRARDDGTTVHHAYRPKGGEGTRYYLTDQIVVRFHRGVGTDQIDAVVEAEPWFLDEDVSRAGGAVSAFLAASRVFPASADIWWGSGGRGE